MITRSSLYGFLIRMILLMFFTLRQCVFFLDFCIWIIVLVRVIIIQALRLIHCRLMISKGIRYWISRATNLHHFTQIIDIITGRDLSRWNFSLNVRIGHHASSHEPTKPIKGLKRFWWTIERWMSIGLRSARVNDINPRLYSENWMGECIVESCEPQQILTIPEVNALAEWITNLTILEHPPRSAKTININKSSQDGHRGYI
jgi:hypothetical protein